MKTEKRKPYQTPSVGVIEITCEVIAVSDTTLTQDDYSIEEASWSGLTPETSDKNGSGTIIENGEWNGLKQ